MVDVLVSIIVPVYNVEQYLAYCLDSVLAQTYPHLEIICINDGSTDSSLSILKRYADRDRRIIVISQENKGLSASRNVGLKHAKGQYVYFLDSDDLIVPESIQELLAVAEKEELDILYYDYKMSFENPLVEEQFHGRWENKPRSKEYTAVMTGQQMFAQMFQNEDYRPHVPFAFYRRDFIENEKLHFYEGIVHEDLLFSFCAMLSAKRVAHRKKTFYEYRIRSGSITTKPVDYCRFRSIFTACYEMFLFASDIEFEADVNVGLNTI